MRLRRFCAVRRGQRGGCVRRVPPRVGSSSAEHRSGYGDSASPKGVPSLRDRASPSILEETPHAHPLFRSAVTWTAVGLAGGLAYREITKLAGFTGFTQLGLVHTHSLALGTTVFLVVLALGAALRLQKHRLMRWFLIVWNAGLALTVAMLAVKGTLQVRGDALADSAAIAGVAGLGT